MSAEGGGVNNEEKRTKHRSLEELTDGVETDRRQLELIFTTKLRNTKYDESHERALHERRYRRI